MPTSEEVLTQIDDLGIERLGILAGGGRAPFHLLEACDRLGIQPFIVAFEGQADEALVEGREHMWSNLGSAGTIMNGLDAHEIKDLVLIGSIRRPSFAELKPDMKTAAFFAKVGMKVLGDSDILSAVRDFLEDHGYTLHGVHKFSQNLLAPEGVIGRVRPSEGNMEDVQRGSEAALNLGALDIGQAVVVQEGFVLAVEAVEGTAQMLTRIKALKRKGRGAVLVKLCKPQQDKNLDLPTIGPDTIDQAAQAGIGGIAVHAGRSLILDRDEVIKRANKHKIFLLGIDVEVQ